MTAMVPITPRTRSRLGAWIAGAHRVPLTVVQCDPAEDTATLVARRTFSDIGEFIFANGLALTATNLDVVLRYVVGNDHDVGEKLRALLAEHGHVTDTMVERVAVETAPGAMTAEVIDGLADRLQVRLDECAGLVARSSQSASSYGDAFDAGVARFDAGHVDALAALRTTAQDLVRTTREMQGELDRHRQETTRLRSELNRARRDAERDHLTGLPNRRCFEAKVKQASEPGSTLVVALCDIDNFKAINDEHGHQTGDRVLRLVAAHLEKELKGKALVARYGGEEFALFFPRVGAVAAAEAIDRARDRLGARSLVDQESKRALRRITFSAGVALLDSDVRAAMRAADRALYRAKHRGKDQVMMSDAAMASVG